jgi:hypothetical protein
MREVGRRVDALSKMQSTPLFVRGFDFFHCGRLDASDVTRHQQAARRPLRRRIPRRPLEQSHHENENRCIHVYFTLTLPTFE